MSLLIESTNGLANCRRQEVADKDYKAVGSEVVTGWLDRNGRSTTHCSARQSRRIGAAIQRLQCHPHSVSINHHQADTPPFLPAGVAGASEPPSPLFVVGIARTG